MFRSKRVEISSKGKTVLSMLLINEIRTDLTVTINCDRISRENLPNRQGLST